MSHVYTVEFDNVTYAQTRDFFEIRPVVDRPVKILAIFIGQSTEAGDAEEELLRWRIIRGHTVSGTGGQVETPRPVGPNQVAAGFAAESRNNPLASGGTPVNLHSDTFNVRTGLVYVPTPEMQIGTDNAEGFLVVRLLGTVADIITFNGTIYIAEGA